MKIGVVGSCFGELDRVYDAVRKLAKQGINIDLLICCGDFMSVRDETDLEHVAAPSRHKEDLKDFPKYFSGRSEAPVTTVFIGGKNEASNLLREHYYGGWVAPGIYYLGAAGVLRVGSLRIAGISGSFTSGDYFRGRHECPPYTEDFKKSAFHAREWDAARLEKLQEPVDVVISYDWPRGIWKHGPYEKIIEQQDLGENLKREMEGNTLGSPAAMELMKKLRPLFWFSASLQVRFPALVSHGDGTFTRFLALERCRGGRDFLQVLDIDPRTSSAMRQLPAKQWQRSSSVPAVVPLCYDAEWMAMQKVNHENISFSWHPAKSRAVAPSKEDLLWVKERLKAICGTRPRAPGGRHPNLTPTKLRKSRGAGRQTFQKFSTLQLRELFEIRGMTFPGHLDKASMIQHLEDFDALHGQEELKDTEEAYPIPTGFIASPSIQRGKILEILQLPDIWKDQEDHRRNLLRAAASGTVEVKYDPFSQAEPERTDPATAAVPGEGAAGADNGGHPDAGQVTGRSPSPSTPTEEDAATQPPAPVPLEAVQPKEVVEATRAEDKNSPEQPEPRKVEPERDGDAELQKMLAMGLGGEAPDPEEPRREDVEPPAGPAETDLVEAAEPPLEVHPDSVEDELAEEVEELAHDPQEPDAAEVPMEPIPVVVAADDEVATLREPAEQAAQAAQAAQLLAEAVMGLADLEAEVEEIEDGDEDFIDGGEAELDCIEADQLADGKEELSGFAALALAVEEAEREEAEAAARPMPRKRRRF